MKKFFDSQKNEAVGYGVSVKNYNGGIEQTVSYQDLKELDIPDEYISIDMVRSDSWKRPKLDNLIESSKPGDELFIISIDTLLVGTNNRGIEYYKKILDKGILLFVIDLSGRVAKLSEFSTCYFDNELEKWTLKTNTEELINKLISYKESNGNLIRTKRINKKLSSKFYTKSSVFKEIYFAYEAYQIDYETTLDLFRNYCGINNIKSIRNLISDYEKLVIYQNDFMDNARIHRDILELPKRSGSIPEEYYILKSALKEFIERDPKCLEEKSIDEIFYIATQHLNYYITYSIYHRWELLEFGRPKPRIPIGRTFKVDEFKRTHHMINTKLEFGDSKTDFILKALHLARGEVNIYNWKPKYYVELPNEENGLEQDDKIKISIDGNVIAINKDWLDSTEDEYEVCSEIWYNFRKMYQHLQVRRKEMKDRREVSDYIVDKWTETIQAENYRDGKNIDIETATEIDAHAFKYYMLSKYFNISKADFPEAIANEISEKLSKEYRLI